MKKKCTLVLLCAFLWAFSNTAFAQNNALSFDGTNYVGMSSDIVPTGTSPTNEDFTVEFWAYIPAYEPGQHYFISQGSLGTAFYIGYDGDDPAHSILAGDQWPAVTSTLGSTGITMPVGKWTHFALVEDYGSFTATLYINGIVAGVTPASTYIITGGGTPLQVGAFYDNNERITGGMDELRIWNIQRTGAQIRAGMYGTVNPATVNLLAYYNMNDNTDPTTVANNSTGPDSYTNGADGGWAGTGIWATSPIQANDNALSFAGSAGNYAQVTIPGKALYDLSSGGTIEMYVNPTNLTSAYSTLISNRGSGGTQYIFQINNNSISLYDGTTRTSITKALQMNTWSHLAFVYNGSGSTTVYYNNDGPVGTLTGAFAGPGAQAVALGVTKNPSAADSDPFQGAIDEVRFWSTQQLQSDIATNIVAPLTGSESGLVGLYNFNQGNAGGNNQYLVTAIDNTANANDATLTNFALTSSSASNFTGHLLVPLPVNFTVFTAMAGKNQGFLKWQTAQEQNSRDFTIERSSDGVSYDAIGVIDAAGNSATPSDYSFIDETPLNGRNYYRLRETDLDGKFMYSDIRMLSFSATDDNQQLVWFQTGDKAVEVNLKLGSNELYSVMDAGGRLVQQGQLSSGKLYLTQQPRGMYVVKVITATGKQLNTQVIVK